MKIKFISFKGMWGDIYKAALTTIGKEKKYSVPPTSWIRHMLLCEHSPIRKKIVSWKWSDLKSWISVHFVRHKIGIEHFVKSQRPDRIGNRDNRDNALQGTLVDHECEANAQAIINISRKRLCNMAMPETRKAWQLFLKTLEPYEPELASVCVPDCIYRGWCYEFKSCNWHLTTEFKEKLNKYRKNINSWEEQNG